jgi:protein-S-isoprenylcysteine O-methyltransferase Ste14
MVVVLSVLEHEWGWRCGRMAKQGFLKKHGIVRNAIKEDMLYFALPGILVFTAGLVVSGFDGWVIILLSLVRHPRVLTTLPAQSLVGLALFVIGFTILLLGQITLGRFYSSTLVIRKDHELITHGVYRLVRHPMYLGVILAAIGLPVSASSLTGFLIMLALVPVFLIRIRMEERLLMEEFGDAYRAYQAATSKLIPFVY